MIQPGDLRHLITIEASTQSRNAVGEITQSWSTFATRHAAIEPLSYNEQSLRGQVGGSTSYSVTIRYVEGITAAMRIVRPDRDGMVLYITGIVELGNREGHDITCEAAA